MCGRAIISRNGLDAWMLVLRNARARGTLASKRTRVARVPPRSIQSAKAAADEESAEAEAADDDGDAPEEPPAERPPLESPGSKKGSMFNLFKRSSSRDLGAGPRGRRPPAPGASTERRAPRARSRRRGSDASTAPLEAREGNARVGPRAKRARRRRASRRGARAGTGEALCAGPLHYKTVVKSMFGGSKAVWKKRRMELVPSSSDDVGPVLRCAKTRGSGDKREALFQIVLEGCTVRDDDAKPTKRAAAFAINHATYAEPKVFYRAGQESDMPNVKGSDLGRFPLVSADFWTSDHLSERSRRVDAVPGTRARGTLTSQRR